MKYQSRFIFRIVCLTLVLPNEFIWAQESKPSSQSTARWLKGAGRAEGADISKMRDEAVAKARVDALAKVGVAVENSALLVKAENAGKMIDFFSQLTSAKTRGIILKERNKIISDPKPIAGAKNTYQLVAELEALIDIQQGDPDAGFEVRSESDKDAYIEEQPVKLSVTSTRDGYLTIFHIHNDSLSVIFPNALSKDNAVKKNTPLAFPPSNLYELVIENETGQEIAVEQFVAVVTKEKIEFPNLEAISIEKKSLAVKQESFSAWAKWLHKIPAHQYASAHKAVKSIRKK